MTQNRKTPDEINLPYPYDAPRYRCHHCGIGSGLQWHKTRPGVPVCSRTECNEA